MAKLHIEIEGDLAPLFQEAIGLLKGINEAQNAILNKLDDLSRKEDETMALIDDLLTDVQAQTTVIDSMETLFSNLSGQIAAAGTDPVKLAAVRTALDANTARITADVLKNTPAAPPAA